MTQEILQSTDFNNFLDSHKESARKEISNDYFHVNVVAEAYSQGFNDGRAKGEKEYIANIVELQLEDYKKRYLQAYILTSKVVDVLKAYDKKPESFYINIHYKNPKVIIAIKDDYLLEDDIVELAYKNIFEAQEIFNTIFQKYHLDISLVGFQNLDSDLLECEGYNYRESIR